MSVPIVLALILVAVESIERAFHCHAPYIEVSSQTAVDAEGVVDTNIVSRLTILRVAVSSIGSLHTVDVTDTYVGSDVPEALLVVAAECVGEVEHHILVDSPVLVAVVVITIVYSLSPDALELGTQTDNRREPLSNSSLEAECATIYAEGILVTELLLVGVSGVEFTTDLDVPV